MSHACSVSVIDDDPGVRNSLCMALETAGMHASGYESAEAFLQAVNENTLGCVILDFRLQGMSGLEMLRQLRDRNIQLPVIMITGHGDVPVAVASMKLGAVDFLEKPVDPQKLLTTLRGLCSVYDQKLLTLKVKAQARERLKDVTPREIELLGLLAAGRSSKQIASDLNISINTVENHRAHMLFKTGADNIAHLVRLAGIAERI